LTIKLCHIRTLISTKVTNKVTIMIAKFVKENKGQLTDSVSTQESNGKKHTSPSIDLKGALAFSITIISFLIALTLVQSEINSKTLPQIGIALVVSIISLGVFVFIERRVHLHWLTRDC